LLNFAAAGAFALLVVGFHPYVSKTVHHGSPFHPATKSRGERWCDRKANDQALCGSESGEPSGPVSGLDLAEFRRKERQRPALRRTGPEAAVHCSFGCTPPDSAQAKLDEGDMLQTLGIVGLAAGGATLATGITLWIFDGNRDNTDGCSNDCISTLDCGNDIQDVENGEECDDGNDDNTDGCIIHPELLCKKASCGDGFVFADKEECDGNGNGNGGETKSCNLNCTTSQCGDGVVNPTDDEQCDDGLENGNYNHCASNCTQTGAMCGDGTRNGPEVCDGQTVTGSDALVVACNADCSGYPPYCGDGDDNAAAETCDDGAANGRYNGVCNNDCTGLPIRCGDTVTQGEHGEQCDLGDENSNNWHAAQDESCTTTCRRGLYCGDGSLTTASESCERGWELEWRFDSRDVKSTCHDDCSGYCGDGRLQNRSRIDNIVIEYCDPEDDAAPDNCRKNCTYCGDGTRQQPAEECDSGAQNRDQPGFCRVDCSGVFPSPD